MGICASQQLMEPLLAPDPLDQLSTILTECSRLLQCVYKEDELLVHIRVYQQLHTLQQMGLLLPKEQEYVHQLASQIDGMREDVRRLAKTQTEE